MFIFKMVLKIVLICLIFAYKVKAFNLISDEFINFHPNTPFSYIKGLSGARKVTTRLPLCSGLGNITDLPENFDAREKWPNCPSLNEIRDQGRCGSCWAHGTVEIRTDRYCIGTEGRKQFHFSAQDLMTCCSDCGGGCEGGDPFEALKYWKEVGIVSGGNHESGEGCSPYTIEHCDYTFSDPTQPCQPYDDTPTCSKTCQGNYSVEYKDDLKRGKEVYRIEGEENMMEEVYTRGPIAVVIDVHEDFYHYNGTSVYRHSSGPLLDQHVLKIIGWGVENGVKYWLGANSWSTNFGDKGFFKFLRGSNHCRIESYVCAGVPDVDD